MVLSRWFAFAGGVATLAAAQGMAGVVAARRPPRLSADAAPPAVPPAEVSIALAPRPQNARAAREKAAATSAGVCDYPGAYVPCWCAHLWGFGPCDSAEDYEEDVQRFGPPRAFVPLHPGGLVVTTED